MPPFAVGPAGRRPTVRKLAHRRVCSASGQHSGHSQGTKQTLRETLRTGTAGGLCSLGAWAQRGWFKGCDQGWKEGTALLVATGPGPQRAKAVGVKGTSFETDLEPELLSQDKNGPVTGTLFPLLPDSFLEKNSAWAQLFFFSVSADINTNSSILTRGVAMGMAEWPPHMGKDPERGQVSAWSSRLAAGGGAQGPASPTCPTPSQEKPPSALLLWGTHCWLAFSVRFHGTQTHGVGGAEEMPGPWTAKTTAVGREKKTQIQG